MDYFSIDFMGITSCSQTAFSIVCHQSIGISETLTDRLINCLGYVDSWNSVLWFMCQ